MRAISYGANNSLFGVFSESKTKDKGILAIAWNTGICGRMGPSRLNVEIAAMLSEQGIPSFRFDVSNHGDSGVASQELDFMRRNREDLKATLDMLSEKLGYRKFLLVGVCSSAVDAHHTAVADDRVVGLIMVDSYVYPTKNFHMNYLKKRIFKPSSWKRFTSRKFKEWTGEKEEIPVEDLYEGVYPNQDEAGRELQSLVDRDVPIFVLYTGGFDHVYTYHDQFLDMFPDVRFKGLLTLKHHPRADHLFTILEDRDLLLHDLRDWALKAFASERNAQGTGDLSIQNERTLIDILGQIDNQNPKDIAIKAWGESYSYADFKDMSHGLAHLLKAEGIGRGSLVGLCLDRSASLIVALSATLRAGSAYLPLDPHYPTARLQAMIEVSRCEVILCHRAHAAKFSQLPVRLIIWEDLVIQVKSEAFVSPALGEHDPAYVIFTSGSTGTPKGVVMGHGALTQLLDWHEFRYPLKKARTLQFTPVSFDVSFQEIFSCLVSGGTLVLIEEDVRLDPLALLGIMEQESIQRLFLPFVALQFLSEAAEMLNRHLPSLLEVFTAGEALKTTPALRQFFMKNSNARLHNHYGPSETHVITAYELPRDPLSWPDLPAIGEAIEGSYFLILNPESGKEVEEGSEGELFLAGRSLAEGYIHRPDLTAERFIKHPRNPNEKIYSTGDRARLNSDGQLEFLGRRDGQIKLRGHRIELSEVEIQLESFPGIGQVLVEAKTLKDQLYLIAYFRADISVDELKTYAANKLPDAMRPSYYIKVANFPLSDSGKVNRKALPLPSSASVPSESKHQDQKEESTPVEADRFLKELRDIWVEILPSDDFTDDQNFFDAGGTSILAMRFVTLLKQRRNIELRTRDFFASPNLLAVRQRFYPSAKDPKRASQTTKEASLAPIAIVGMAIDIPGMHDLDSYFSMLLEGRTNLSRFQNNELDESLDRYLTEDPNYVPVRAVLEEAQDFDHDFFSIPKREAELIDPQQRRLLQLCWAALEDAGMSESAKGSLSGVFLGTSYNSYLLKQILKNPEIMNRAGDFQIMLANDKDYVASRVAYKLDLKGPALAINTACSTSLVATVAAVQSLRRGECDVALAGAMSIQFPAKAGHLYQEGDIMSRDGSCRPFDAEASGTMFCDGGAVITLKRLDDAIAAGDRIYSVIRGAAWNNDGHDKASFSAPSIHGQKDVILAAIEDAGVDSESISYIEAHGTATPIGDPMEWEGIRLAYAKGKDQKANSRLVGSVKGNIGHTTHSAGVLGLIKTSLALYYEKIPGTAHFKRLNPDIDAGPFYVQSEAKAWPRSNIVRRAGISSFGVGGTNSHIILEEAPEIQTKTKTHPIQLLTVSHKTEEGLADSEERAIQVLQNSRHSLASIANAYGTGRKHFAERAVLLINAKREIIGNVCGKVLPRKLIWVFPGQGSQVWGMGRELHESDPLFRTIWDDVCQRILELTQFDLKAQYWETEKGPISNTRSAQLGLFAIGYALGKSLMDRGIKPHAMMGHSVGEWVAASLSGLWQLDDAIRILNLRAKLMENLPEGAMLSVRASLDQVITLKPKDLDLAAANGPLQQVFSGPTGSIETFARDLESQGIASRRLESRHAFHSWMLEDVCKALQLELEKVQFSDMAIPMISSVHGRELSADEAKDPRYWSAHARVPVQFHAALKTAAKMGDIILAELGPRTVASKLARKELSSESLALPVLGEEREDLHFAKFMAQLWISGMIASDSIQTTLTTERAPGIQYQFTKKRFSVATATQKSGPSMGEINMRRENIREDIRSLVEECSGELIARKDDALAFVELGLDSLFLTQLSLQLRNRFKVEISFRQLMEELGSIESIAQYIDNKLPASEAQAPVKAASINTAAVAISSSNVANLGLESIQKIQSSIPVIASSDNSHLNSIFSRQLAIIQQQLALLSGQALVANPIATVASAQLPDPTPVQAAHASSVQTADKIQDPVDDDPSKKVFGAMAKISKATDSLAPLQKQSIESFQKAYNRKTKLSKEQTVAARPFMADPRVVTGFKPVLKEMVYPIIVKRSKGAELWDIDGNHYVDMLNGFGSNFFGYSPDFITEALKKQIDEGYELGPQHPLAIEASALAVELTGWDRVAWCNTGSEAVLGAMRIARTVTGRSRIASFTGSYHGINDEVILRGNKQLRSIAAAPGIMNNAVQNMLVLDYGTDEALNILREQCKDLAAILVEPVQSRRPEFQPIEFLKELRKITEEHGTLLIFDEVITGFRYHPAGFAGAVGIKPDLATYGKVVGGGLPIGMIGGRRQFIDALDGGQWSYGDQSIPEVGVTYFAGTFVRHPLALAAAVATMKRLKTAGPALQASVNQKADRYCKEINAIFKKYNAPFTYANFGSLMKLKINDDAKGYPELLATWLRGKGVHIWDGFPTFVTASHTDEQLDWVIKQFDESIREMQMGGLLGEVSQAQTIQYYSTVGMKTSSYYTDSGRKEAPDHPNAKLGVDESGQAAWFVPDPDRPGKYRQILID